MKPFSILSLLSIVPCAVFAQTLVTDQNTFSKSNQLNNAAQNRAGVTGAAFFYNPKFDREGSVHLFDGWDNRARIYLKGGGHFDENNINFNIQRSQFEAKKAKDSIATYNFRSIEKITVGGRTFKSFYYDALKRGKIFEIVYEGDNFNILKNYEIDIQQASPNPMLARGRDKVIQRHDYYVETKEKVEKFKLKRKTILALLGPEKAEKAGNYAKKHRMSFRKEADLNKILNYAHRD